MADINSFGDSLSPDQLQSLFYNYHRGKYDFPLSYHRLKSALKDYLIQFIFNTGPDGEGDLDERTIVLSSLVQTGNYSRLRDKLRTDPFYEEPLIRVIGFVPITEYLIKLLRH